MKPKTVIFFSTIFLLLVVSPVIANNSGSLVQTSLIVNEQKLTDWGYRTNAYGDKDLEKWEVSKFGKANISYQKIKSIKEVPGWPNAYYRFIIIKEAYPSNRAASRRLKMLKVIPREMESKQFPEYILRKGFVHNNSVYIVSTDVLKFEIEELPRIFQLLKEYITQSMETL